MQHIALSAALLAAATMATAAPVQSEDLDLLDARVAVFLGGTAAEAGLRAVRIDRRLRFARCPEGALFETPQSGSMVAYCPAKGWRLHIPLVAAASDAGDIVIRRGDSVDLSHTGSGYTVVAATTSLEDGRIGGRVRVKLSTGTGSVSATVRGPGTVMIGD